MTINQLFRKSPTKELIIEMLNIIGLNDLDDRRKFTKKDLDNTEIIEEFSKLKDKFEEYYLPCKLKIYFTDINCKRIITILRQCLKLFNYSIKSQEKYMKGDKLILYHIEPNNINKINLNKTNCTIVFD